MGGLLSVNVHQLDVKSMKDRDRWAVIKEELAKHPERSNEKNKVGETPLHCCAKMGSGIERMIELFVAHGGDCNIPNSDGLTVLHINCSCGGGLIDIFVKNGANVNALDNQGQPPVMYALIYRNESVFEASFPVKCTMCAILMLTFVCRVCGSAGQTSI
jgi:ankyrin repeat protein